MGNSCSCTDTAVEPEKKSIDSAELQYYDENHAPLNLFNEDSGRRASNASQITHFSDGLDRRKSRAPGTGMIEETYDEDNGSDLSSVSTDFMNDLPSNIEPSVGPFPSDRRLSTTTQEAVYIYQSSSRAAERIHEENFKSRQLETLPFQPTTREQWKKKSRLGGAVHPTFASTIEGGHDLEDLHDEENIISEEDLRNKTRMGRQSLTIQPQPESRFLREYRMKQQRKTMGNIFEDNLSRTSSNSTSNGTGNFIPDARSSKHSYDDSIIKKTNDLDTVSRRGSF